MNCNTTHYRANSSSVPGDPTEKVPQQERQHHGLEERAVWLVDHGVRSFEGKTTDWIYEQAEATGYDAHEALEAEKRKNEFSYYNRPDKRPLVKLHGIRIHVVKKYDSWL